MTRANARPSIAGRLVSQLCGAAFVVTLGGATATPTAARNDVPKVIPHADLRVPDPIQIAAAATEMHVLAIYETLSAQDENLLPQPMMAESVNASADGLTCRITLRPGLRFHDGQPVTAADVVPSIKRWWETCHAYFICPSVYGTEAGAEGRRTQNLARAR